MSQRAGLSEHVVHGNGDILGAEHVVLVNEISLLRWAFLHHVASGLAGSNQAHLDSLGIDFFAESFREGLNSGFGGGLNRASA